MEKNTEKKTKANETKIPLGGGWSRQEALHVMSQGAFRRPNEAGGVMTQGSAHPFPWLRGCRAAHLPPEAGEIKKGRSRGTRQEPRAGRLGSLLRNNNNYTNNNYTNAMNVRFSSVQFSHSVMSDSLWPHGLQHTRPLCPLPTPRVYSNSGPLSQWCHPTISSSVIPFSSCPLSFPASLGTRYCAAAAAAKLLQYCLTLWDSIDGSPPSSSVPGILQARILEWVAIPFSRGSSRFRDQICVSYVLCIGRRVLYL